MSISILANYLLLAVIFCSFSASLSHLITLPIGLKPIIWLARINACLVISVFFILIYAYIVSDFSVSNVFNNSHSGKPLFYKISAAWGNHEGSSLLWSMLLAVITLVFSWQSVMLELKKFVLSLLTLFSGFLAIYIFKTSNPFDSVFPVPTDGLGFNPILQDVALAMHPPILYFGYITLSVTFAISVFVMFYAYKNWLSIYRFWLYISLVFTTIGIGLGSWWAYRELGWGGFWFWDPVENSSLMPWLLILAQIHVLKIYEKQKIFLSWLVILSIASFSFSIFGTFLVRSGLLTSVHSFASSPERGIMIIGFFLLVFIGFFAVFVWKIPKLLEQNTQKTKIGYQTIIVLLGSMLLFTSFVTIFIGTTYPLLLDLIIGQKISVAAPYYNVVSAFLLICIFSVLYISGYVSYSSKVFFNYKVFIGQVVVCVMIMSYLWPKFTVISNIVLVFLILSMFATTESFIRKPDRRIFPSFLAHLSLMIFVFSCICYGNFSKEAVFLEQIPAKIIFDDFNIMVKKLNYKQNEDYVERSAIIEVWRDNVELISLEPATRYFQVEENFTTETVIYHHPLYDLYFALGEMRGEKIIIKIFKRPMMFFIWFSFIMLAFAALLSIIIKKYPKTKRV